MAEADKHISLPRIFSSGDFKEWLKRFNICAKVNGWDDSKKNAKVAPFLDGDALAVYLELDRSKDKFADVVAALVRNFHSPSEEFNIITAFNERKMLPNESPRLFLHELKKLLKSSGIPESAHEKLLLHQFICGLPPNVSAHIKLLQGVDTLEAVLKATQKLNTVSSSSRPMCNAVATTTGEARSKELDEMKSAIQTLTAKVDALLGERQDGRRLEAPQPEVAALRKRIVCYRCQKPGHPARLCRAPAPASHQSGNGRGRGAAMTRHFGRNHQGSTSS